MNDELKRKMQEGRKNKKPITHTVRINGDERNTTLTIEKYTRNLAIKLMCTECLGYETNPKECTSPKCPLFPFRKMTYVAYDKDAL